MTIELVKDYLSREGYKYEQLSDKLLAFRYQGLGIICEEDRNDQYFFRLMMPRIYEIEGNRQKVIEATNKITADIKVVKAFVEDDNHVWISIEMYLDSSPEIDDFMDRCLGSLNAVWHKLQEMILG